MTESTKPIPPTRRELQKRNNLIERLVAEGKNANDIAVKHLDGKHKKATGKTNWQGAEVTTLIKKLSANWIQTTVDSIDTIEPLTTAAEAIVTTTEPDSIAEAVTVANDAVQVQVSELIEPEAVEVVNYAIEGVILDAGGATTLNECNDDLSRAFDDNKGLFVVGIGGAGGVDKNGYRTKAVFIPNLMDWNSFKHYVKDKPFKDTAKLDAPWLLCSNRDSRKAIDQQAAGVEFSIIKADLDGHTPLEVLHPILASFNCKLVAYSTHSANVDCQKWRVVIVLDKPANAEEFVILSAILNDKLEAAGIVPDRSSQGVAQISFIPNHNGVFYETVTCFSDDAPLDWSTVWANELADKKADKIKLDADKSRRFEQSQLKAAEMIANGNVSPRDAFNLAYSIESCFDAYGYIKQGSNKWLSPKSESGVAGVTLWTNRFGEPKWHSEHGNDVIAGIGRLETHDGGKPYCYGDAFDLYIHFVHGGNSNESNYKTIENTAVIAAGAMFTTESGQTISAANQARFMRENDDNSNDVDLDAFILAVTDKATTPTESKLLPLDFILRGQINGDVTVAKILNPVNTPHYQLDSFLHPYAPTGDADYCFFIDTALQKGISHHDVDNGKGAWEYAICHKTEQSNFFRLEQLPVPEVDTAPKPKFSLAQFALNGSSNAMRSKMLLDVFVLAGVALLGQSTVIYAKPNSGKTLLVLFMLIESIKAGRIKGENVYYINADDTYKGLVIKLELAEKHGFNMLAPNENGFKTSNFNNYIKSMIDDGTAHGVVIVLDTLKKFTDLMDKKEGTKFGKMAREFVSAGGTLITLAHTNKNRTGDGKVVFGGTSDITDDCDCAFTLDEVSNDDVTKQVLFENFKSRGSVEQKLAFSYAAKSSSYEQLFDSVQQGDENTIDAFVNNLAMNYQLDKDKPAIDAIIDAITQGYHSRTELVAYAAKTNSIAKPKLTTVLDTYAGDVLSRTCYWRVVTGNKNSKMYHIDDIATGQIELDGAVL